VQVEHFYHVYADGDWEWPVEQHQAALEASAFPNPIQVGLVGRQERRLRASAALPGAIPCAEADSGWEQVTLAAVQAYAHQHDGAVLYAHTKGAAMGTVFNHRWRHSMQRHVIDGWEFCRDKLDTGRYDAIGCHWLTRADFPERAHAMADGFFGGNFWMATCDYLRQLPPCLLDNRWDAESWIGLGKPRIYDLLEGWPSDHAFTRGGTP
jgi:hypothetical protein